MLTQTDVLIATRIYHDLNPLTGEECELRDRLLRTGERSFVLMVAGEKPGDPEIAKSIGLAGVFDWYQDCPEQIERAVIVGGLSASLAKQMGTRGLGASPT